MPRPAVFNPPASGASLYPPNITNSNAALASATSITPINTFVDAVTLSLVAGTWLIVAHGIISQGSTTNKITARLWDGTTTFDETENSIQGSAAGTMPVSLASIVTLGSTTTVKLSAAVSSVTSTPQWLADPPDNSSAAHKSTQISAIRLA